MKESAILKLKEGCSAMGLWSTTVAAWQQGRQHRRGRQLQHKTWRWSTSSATMMVLAASGWWVGGRWLICGFGGWWPCVGFFFFFFLGLWVWVLWSKAGTDGGHRLGRRHWFLYWLGDEKLMWGCGVYTNCQDWVGLVQDLMGQILER